jgi:hypothetical protein
LDKFIHLSWEKKRKTYTLRIDDFIPNLKERVAASGRGSGLARRFAN